MFAASFFISELYAVESLGYDVFGHRDFATGFLLEWYTVITIIISIIMILVSIGFGLVCFWLSDMLSKAWRERKPVILVKLTGNFSNVVTIV